jgi:hypothetical protein
MRMETLILAAVSGSGIVFILTRAIPWRFLMRFSVAIDVAFTILIPVLFAGTFAGMMLAILTGIVISIWLFFLKLFTPKSLYT